MPSKSVTLPEFSKTIFYDDFSGLTLGNLPMQSTALAAYHAVPLPGAEGLWRMPVNHGSWAQDGACFRIVQTETGRALETLGASPQYENRILIAGEAEWGDYRVTGHILPLSAEGGRPAGGFCGLIARYEDSRNYLALILDRDGRAKLLRRREDTVDVLADAPAHAAAGQSLEFELAARGERISGRIGAVLLSTRASGFETGKIGLLADIAARFGPIRVESSEREVLRLSQEQERAKAIQAKRVKRHPSMDLLRQVPLGKLVNGRNLRLADLNGDGQPEIIVAQRSPEAARKLGLTRLTCLSVLDLEGRLLWQSGVPDPDAEMMNGDLPFQIYDVDGDGRPEVVCVFGFDIQIRDGQTGKILWSVSTPETATVGNDFKEISSNWGAAWGDETLNMDVAQLLLCNTQGRTGAREILVKDDYHHLVVLDIDPIGATTLIRHRGTHGHFPWVGDLDGDGCDEIAAGASLLDHSGKRLWSLPMRDHCDAVAVLDPLAPGGKNRRIILCGGEDGLLFLGLGGACHARQQGHAQRLGIAKFRSDLPGLQIATVTNGGNPGIFRLHDATCKLLWSKELPLSGGLATPVNWTGAEEELLLYSMAPGAGLLDGHGELVVEAPREGPNVCFDTTPYFSRDGRDCLIAWDRDSLSVYGPSDAPLKGAKARSIYRPSRPILGNRSNYQASVSIPPEW